MDGLIMTDKNGVPIELGSIVEFEETWKHSGEGSKRMGSVRDMVFRLDGGSHIKVSGAMSRNIDPSEVEVVRLNAREMVLLRAFVGKGVALNFDEIRDIVRDMDEARRLAREIDAAG